MGEKGLKWLEQLWQCFLSIVKILLQSKWRTRLPSSFSNPDELLILANGPSLNRTVEDSTDFIKGKTLLAVNFCVSSPMFEHLRPELLSDCRPAVLDRSREAYTAFQDNGREDYLGYELLCPCPCPEE